MWLSKPIYEALPYYYMVAGVIVLSASAYLDYWLWPLICLAVGFSCLIAGMVVWLKRRDARRRQRRRRQVLEQD